MTVLHRSAGGSAVGLLATGAWRRAAVGDDSYTTPKSALCAPPTLPAQFNNLPPCGAGGRGMSASPPIASELWRRSEMTRCARSRHMQRSKQHLYSITSSAIADKPGG